MIKRAEAFLKDYLKLLTSLDFLISKGIVSIKLDLSSIKSDLSKEIKLLESFLKEFKWVDEVR